MRATNFEGGTVAEWTIAPALKAGGPKGPGVRIPSVPPIDHAGGFVTLLVVPQQYVRIPARVDLSAHAA